MTSAAATPAPRVLPLRLRTLFNGLMTSDNGGLSSNDSADGIRSVVASEPTATDQRAEDVVELSALSADEIAALRRQLASKKRRWYREPSVLISLLALLTAIVT